MFPIQWNCDLRAKDFRANEKWPFTVSARNSEIQMKRYTECNTRKKNGSGLGCFSATEGGGEANSVNEKRM